MQQYLEFSDFFIVIADELKILQINILKVEAIHTALYQRAEMMGEEENDKGSKKEDNLPHFCIIGIETFMSRIFLFFFIVICIENEC